MAVLARQVVVQSVNRIIAKTMDKQNTSTKSHLAKKTSLYKYIVFIFLFVNCNNEKIEDSQIETIKIDPDNLSTLNISINNYSTRIIDLSDIRPFINKIKNIAFIDSLIIIFDGELRSICLSSKEVRSLAKQGRGPNEFYSVNSVKALQSGVYYLDRRKMKLNKIFFDGSPTLEMDLDSNPSDFTIINDSLMALYHGSFPFQDQNFRVSIFDINKNKHISNHISYPKEHWNYLHFDDWNNFSDYRGNKLLSFSGSNIVYKYDESEKEFVPLLKFDFGSRSLTETILNKDYNEVINFSKEIDKNKIFARVISFYETRNYLILSSRVGSHWYLYTYNKTTKSSKIFNSIAFNDQSPLNLCFDLIPIGYNSGQLIFILEPNYIIDNPILHDLLPIDKENLSDINNPVILMIDENAIATEI